MGCLADPGGCLERACRAALQHRGPGGSPRVQARLIRTMLNFDETRFLRIQSGAVAQLEPIHAIVAKYLPHKENLFFLGTGGAQILMRPAADLLQRRSGLPAYCEIAAELV